LAAGDFAYGGSACFAGGYSYVMVRWCVGAYGVSGFVFEDSRCPVGLARAAVKSVAMTKEVRMLKGSVKSGRLSPVVPSSLSH
jgi:hypothetical protein